MSGSDQDGTAAVGVVRRAMGAFVEGDLDAMFAFIADDAVIEMPYEGDHGVDVLDKAGFRVVIETVQAMYERFELDFERLVPLADGVGVLGEYRGDAVFAGSGVAYANRYCGIFSVVDGVIVRWREYDNPLILRAALEAHLAHPSQAS